MIKEFKGLKDARSITEAPRVRLGNAGGLVTWSSGRRRRHDYTRSKSVKGLPRLKRGHEDMLTRLSGGGIPECPLQT